MRDHRVVSAQEWAAACAELLRREKEHTRAGDELARLRRVLPWVAVGKEYRFDTDDGPRLLEELFEGRSQLMFYHFMFGPSYAAGCRSTPRWRTRWRACCRTCSYNAKVAGMRERVAVFGGQFHAGPGPGGFAVRARLPLGDGLR